MNHERHEKKKIAPLSPISFVVSLLAVGLWTLVFSNIVVLPICIILSLVSVIMPAIAKKVRIRKMFTVKSLEFAASQGLEFAALLLGGFACYMVISVTTNWNIYFGYLGWIVGGIVYKLVK